MSCANLICTGIAVMPGGGASAGDFLKSTRTNISAGNALVPTNGSWQTFWTHSHIPSDAQSYFHITVAAVFKLSAPSGISEGEWRISLEVGGVTAGGTVLVTEGNRETGSSSPILGLQNLLFCPGSPQPPPHELFFDMFDTLCFSKKTTT